MLAVWDALNRENAGCVFRRLFQPVWRQIDLRKAVFDKLHSDVDVAGCLRIIEPGASTGHPIRPLSGCPIFDWQAGFTGFAEGIVGQLKCQGTMCFAFFGPALGKRFGRCVIAIPTFLGGL